jgi:hypothetical protein
MPDTRWELTISASAEVIPGDPPETEHTEEPEEQQS